MAVFKFMGITAGSMTSGQQVKEIKIRKLNGQYLNFFPPNGHTEWMVNDQLTCTDTYCITVFQHDPRFAQVS
jgi:hypothetical protein